MKVNGSMVPKRAEAYGNIKMEENMRVNSKMGRNKVKVNSLGPAENHTMGNGIMIPETVKGF